MVSLLDGEGLEVDKVFATIHGLGNALVYSAVKKEQEFSAKKIHDVLGFMSINTIQRALVYLQERDYIQKNRMSKEEIKNYVISAKAKRQAVCEWCDSNVIYLQEHHYPVPREEGGMEVVNICPNCHYDFHHIERRWTIK